MSRMDEWEVWVEWQARSDWTVDDGARRVAESMRAVHRSFPDGNGAFKAGVTSKQILPVDDPDLARRVAPKLRPSRNRSLFAGSDLLGDAHLSFSSVGPPGVYMHLSQLATGRGFSEARLELKMWPVCSPVLAEQPERVIALMADLAAIWQARNAWIDMTHVRQGWNLWSTGCPVFGWATWLHPTFSSVDTSGLDVDVRAGTGGGSLIVLRVDPAGMSDRKRAVGKEVIRSLASRAILSDGRSLVEANERLRQALAAEGTG